MNESNTRLFRISTTLRVCSARISWRQVLTLAAVFVIGLTLAEILFLVADGWESNKAEELFSLEGERHLQSINRGVDSFLSDNNAYKSFMQINPDANYAVVKLFTRNQMAPAVRQNTLISLGYVPLVLNKDRLEFEERACEIFCEASGRQASDFFIRNDSLQFQREIPKERYFPILYPYPFEVNKPILLFDISSTDSRNLTVKSAIENPGKIRATPRELLLREVLAKPERGSYGILLIQAIWRVPHGREVPPDEDLEEDLEQLQALSVQAVLIQDLFQLAANTTRAHDVELFLFDISDLQCSECSAGEALRGDCKGCSPEFLHALGYGSASQLTYSCGYQKREGQLKPCFNREEVDAVLSGSNLVYYSKVEVYGRLWGLVVVGDVSIWKESAAPRLLGITVVVGTALIAVLMLISFRQNSVNSTLKEKAIARLKVITSQQWRDRATSAAAEVQELLLNMASSTSHPDGSRKQTARRSLMRVQRELRSAPGLAVVCIDVAYAKEIEQMGCSVMEDFQCLFRETFQHLLVRKKGVDISDPEQEQESAVMAALETTSDACSLVLELMSELAGADWPEEMLKLPNFGEVRSDQGFLQLRGPRLKAAIHWSNATENIWAENAAGGTQFYGRARYLAARIAAAAMPGQVLMTRPATEQQVGRSEDSGFAYMRPLGTYDVWKNQAPMLLCQLEPPPWDILKPGVLRHESVDGLERVDKHKHSLLAPPGMVLQTMQAEGDELAEKQSGSAASNAASLTVVLMSCPTFARDDIAERVRLRISDTVEALAQIYCGYLIYKWPADQKLPQAVFLSTLNATKFCAGLQLALLNAPWQIEDQRCFESEETTSAGRYIFRGPRVSMFISCLPRGSYKWRSVLRKSTRSLMRRPPSDPSMATPSRPSNNTSEHNPSSVSISTDPGRPLVVLGDVGQRMYISGPGVNFAVGALQHVSPGQIVMSGDAWQHISQRLPNDTRPLDLGVYNLTDSEKPVQLIEVQVRQLQLRRFHPIANDLKLSPGYYDAPDPRKGIAYMMCQLDPTITKQVKGTVLEEAVVQWNALVRSLVRLHSGYESKYIEPGGFCLVFPSIDNGLQFAVAAQKQAMNLDWSSDLLKLRNCEEVFSEGGSLLFRGMRVKMGMSFGSCQTTRPSPTGQADYPGAFVNICAACMLAASPGQVIVEAEALLEDLGDEVILKDFSLDEVGNRKIGLELLGKFRLRGISQPTLLVSAFHPDHRERAFSAPPGRISDEEAAEMAVLGHGSQMEEWLQGSTLLSRDSETNYSHRIEQSMNESLACVMREILVDRLGWSKPKFRSDETVQVQSIIGLGSHGKVFKGLWKGVTVAYKVIQHPGASLNQQEKFRQTAVMETAISASMSHPNVVQTYSYNIKPIVAQDRRHDEEGASSGSIKDWQDSVEREFNKKEEYTSDKESIGAAAAHIIMWEVQIIQEYCEHGSLRKVLDSKTYLDGSTGLLEAGTMLKIAGDVARGMLHIHGMQIIHGDLKAQNILITSGRGIVAKVADFGLSVHMSHEQTHISGVHAGTLTHMAPEILMCGRISKSADVYAFGILLFEILTGEKAFKGVPAMQLTADVTTRCRRPHFPPGSPKQYALLSCIILDALLSSLINETAIGIIRSSNQIHMWQATMLLCRMLKHTMSQVQTRT
uniref:Kinase-like protein n=1 Tax=Tetraselmis sp. GSL018 TaxID=582737 RepID=A0A061RD42_9CHLO